MPRKKVNCEGNVFNFLPATNSWWSLTKKGGRVHQQWGQDEVLQALDVFLHSWVPGVRRTMYKHRFGSIQVLYRMCFSHHVVPGNGARAGARSGLWFSTANLVFLTPLFWSAFTAGCWCLSKPFIAKAKKIICSYHKYNMIMFLGQLLMFVSKSY